MEDLVLPENEMAFTTIEKSSDGIILTNERGVIVEWSKIQEDLTGLTRSEALGQCVWDVQFQLSAKEKSSALRDYLKGKFFDLLNIGKAHYHPGEHIFRHIDGTLRRVRTQVFLFNQNHEIFVGTINQDVTNLRQAEQALHSLYGQVMKSSCLKPKNIFNVVCRELAQAFELPRVTVMLLDESKTTATVVAEYIAEGQNRSSLNEVISTEQPHFRRLIRQKTPLVIPGGEELARDILFPLIVKNETIGFLHLDLFKHRTLVFRVEEFDLAWRVLNEVASIIEDRSRSDSVLDHRPIEEGEHPKPEDRHTIVALIGTIRSLTLNGQYPRFVLSNEDGVFSVHLQLHKIQNLTVALRTGIEVVVIGRLTTYYHRRNQSYRAIIEAGSVTPIGDTGGISCMIRQATNYYLDLFHKESK